MAARIAEVLGEQRLVESVGDPFVFVELYRKAALADPTRTPPFSDEALAVIRELGERVRVP